MNRTPERTPERAPHREPPAAPLQPADKLADAAMPARTPASPGALDQALSRVAGAELVPGNRVRLLKDAAENYPAWLDAIASAQRWIHFELYIVHDDPVGRQFAHALAERARAGVRVRLVYDWLGGLGKTPRRFWRALRTAGVEVRCFNRPRLDDPLGWLSRDHRKMLAVDGRVGFVSGLCVGRMWAGDAARGIEPWRDTGVEIEGPAVADVERAFAQVWAMTGTPLPAGERPADEPPDTAPALDARLADDEPPAEEATGHEPPGPQPPDSRLPGRWLPASGPAASDALPAAGDVALRVIATVPGTMAMYRVDQLVAAAAQHTLWLTDAYFVGVNSYVHALRAAAHDGVDVRLLVPGASDIPLVAALSRAAYRPLLEAGVRVFEWNGPMLHAKTAVADGRWARIGSTNLNLASWMGNCELDVTVEDERFAGELAEQFERDLCHATEIVLAGRRVARIDGRRARRRKPPGSRAGSANRVAAGALSAGSAVGAVLASRRELGPAEASVLAALGALLLALGAAALAFPRLAAIPMGLLAAWFGVALLVKARRLRDAPPEP